MKIQLKIWKTTHLLVDWLIPRNKQQAKLGDQILINHRNFRYAGVMATVIEEDREYTEDCKGKVSSKYNKGDLTIRFADTRVIYNLTPKEYWIWDNNKTKISY